MTPQLLIIKIQSLVNGTTKLDEGQIKLLAAEYKKLHDQSAQRLERCIALIKTNRDYLALELAESEPPLIDTISAISFEELPKWEEICEHRGIALCPPFDEYYIELLQSLYTKNIGQTHPLYRDYRRAMRLHNFKNALKIIGTISRINSNNFEIQQEYLRLLNSEITKSFVELKEALADNKKQEALEIYEFLERNKDSFNEDENDWASFKSPIDVIRKENAQVHSVELISGLNSLDLNRDWALCLRILDELKYMQDEYAISLSDEDLALTYAKRAAAKEQKALSDLESLKISTTANVQNILNSEDRHLSLKSRLKMYKKLRKDKKLIKEDTLNKLQKRISRLSKILLLKRLSQTATFACIITICALAYLYGEEKFKMKMLFDDANAKISQITLGNSVENTRIAIEGYKKEYDALSARKGEIDAFKNRPHNLINKQASLDNTKKNFDGLLDKYNLKLIELEGELVLQTEYMAKADDIIDRIANIQVSDLSNAIINSVKADYRSLEEISGNMLSRDEEVYSVKIKESNNAYLLKVNKREEDYAVALKAIFENALLAVNALDFDTSAGSIEGIYKAKEAVDALDKTISENSSFYALSNIERNNLNAIKADFDAEKAKLDSFVAMKNNLSTSYKIDDYISALKDLQSNMDLPKNLRKNIGDIISLSDELKFGNEINNFTKKELENTGDGEFSKLESFPVKFLDVSDVYIYDNGAQKVYTQGQLKDVKTSTWTGGYELEQTGKVFTERGTVINVRNHQSAMSNKITDDNTYKNGVLSQESVFVNELQKEKHSLLKLVNLIYSAKVDPIFKAWMENEIFNLLKADEANSGFLYSKAAQDRAKLVSKNAIGLNNLSWTKQNPKKRKEIEYSLYGNNILRDLELEASSRLNAAKAVVDTSLNIIGYVDESGKLSIDPADFAGAEIYAVDLRGKQILLIKDGKLLTKAMPFSPLILRD